MSARRGLVVLMLLALPRAAFADASPDVDAARKLREDAAAAASKSDYQACKEKAAESFRIAKQPQSAGLLGLCENELHDYRDAAEHLDYAIRFDPSSDHLADYQTKLGEVKKHVGAIMVTTTPDGANITLDGKQAGAAPETLFVDPGHYRIVAAKDGFNDRAADVNATAGAEQRVAMSLDPKAATPDSRPARPLWPGIVGLGLGAVSLGVAGGLIAVHGADLSSATTLGKGLRCDPSHVDATCQKVASDMSAAQTTGNVAGGLFIAGGVALATGGGLLIWAVTGPTRKTAGKDTSFSWSMVPVFDRRGGGAIVAGSF